MSRSARDTIRLSPQIRGQHGDRVVEAGAFELLVGRSSRDEDLLRAEFTVV